MSLCIDWDSDIIPSQEELVAEKRDPLTRYFSEATNNTKLFRTYEGMQKLIGNYQDVPIEMFDRHH